MSAISKIEWTDATWNPVRGCAMVSAGCEHCYAMRQAHRFSGKGQPYEGLTRLDMRWVGRARFVPEMLPVPMRWESPRRIFVNSMSDLFHGDITNRQISAVFAVMAACPQHTFIVLTKRPNGMNRWYELHPFGGYASKAVLDYRKEFTDRQLDRLTHVGSWPLPNVWLGVSCEDQSMLAKRVLPLLQTPAAIRWVSLEPLLAPIRFIANRFDPLVGMDIERPNIRSKIDWVVVGAESGPGARPMNEDWVRSIRDECKEVGTPFFYKQKLENGRKVSLPFLDGLRYAEYPGGHR
ncbi:MAG: phage Gp37/Gp68 family protein [Patescibacteria group bacterium]